MSKNDEQKEIPKHTHSSEPNDHVGWTTEIIYVNKANFVGIY
jgi:acyl transferase domain-containing protein